MQRLTDERARLWPERFSLAYEQKVFKKLSNCRAEARKMKKPKSKMAVEAKYLHIKLLKGTLKVLKKCLKGTF